MDATDSAEPDDDLARLLAQLNGTAAPEPRPDSRRFARFVDSAGTGVHAAPARHPRAGTRGTGTRSARLRNPHSVSAWRAGAPTTPAATRRARPPHLPRLHPACRRDPTGGAAAAARARVDGGRRAGRAAALLFAAAVRRPCHRSSVLRTTPPSRSPAPRGSTRWAALRAREPYDPRSPTRRNPWGSPRRPPPRRPPCSHRTPRLRRSWLRPPRHRRPRPRLRRRCPPRREHR